MICRIGWERRLSFARVNQRNRSSSSLNQSTTIFWEIFFLLFYFDSIERSTTRPMCRTMHIESKRTRRSKRRNKSTEKNESNVSKEKKTCDKNIFEIRRWSFDRRRIFGCATSENFVRLPNHFPERTKNWKNSFLICSTAAHCCTIFLI